MMQLSETVSRKMRFFSFVSMVLLVFVHGYNLRDRYLQPFSFVYERMTFTAYLEYFLANGVLRFRIPMLFVISGYLFALHDQAPFGIRIRKRIRTLLLPYFLWTIIGLLIAVALFHFPPTHDAVANAHLQPTNKTFDEYTLRDWLLCLLAPTSYQLWFIRSLFFYNLLYPVLKAGVIKFPKVVFPILTLLWVSHFGFFVLEGEGLLSFSLGIWLCKRNKDVQAAPRWFSLRLFATLFFAVTIVKTWMAFHLYRFMGQLPAGITLMILHRFVVASGLMVAWFGLDQVANRGMRLQWFTYLSGFSFMIYALHVPLITYLIDPVFGLVHQWPLYRLTTFFMLPMMIIAFCMGTGWLLRSIAPKIYALLTGNRGLASLRQKPGVARPQTVVADQAAL